MQNTKIYRATFSGLIVTAFGKEQTLKLRIELTMYQVSSNPERWTITPTLPTGRPQWEASSPVELAKLAEGGFINRETDWVELPQQQPLFRRPRPANVIEMPQRKVS